MNLCPICSSPMNEYIDNEGGWQRICWSCGHYESDSPAYLSHPEMFENMARDNPQYFLQKFLILKPSDGSLQHHDSRRRVDRTR